MADRYVAFLRGINVGRAKRVAMADLRGLIEELGFTEVRTVLNSGNVLFSGKRGAASGIAARIETALERRIKVQSRVTVLTGADLTSVVRDNPIRSAEAEPSRFLVAFLKELAVLKVLSPLARQDWTPDTFAAGSRAVYLWCHGGILESRLLTAVSRAAGDGVTTRNWATVTRLHATL